MSKDEEIITVCINRGFNFPGECCGHHGGKDSCKYKKKIRVLGHWEIRNNKELWYIPLFILTLIGCAVETTDHYPEKEINNGYSYVPNPSFPSRDFSNCDPVFNEQFKVVAWLCPNSIPCNVECFEQPVRKLYPEINQWSST